MPQAFSVNSAATYKLTDPDGVSFKGKIYSHCLRFASSRSWHQRVICVIASTFRVKDEAKEWFFAEES